MLWGKSIPLWGILLATLSVWREPRVKPPRVTPKLVIFPELSLTGYPPRDLVEKPSFIERSEEELQRLARETAGLDLSVVCGYVARAEAETGKRALNSAAVLQKGEIVFRQSKMLLPNYDVFDEARYFLPAERASLCTIGGQRIALTICEDAWNDRRFWKHRLYRRDPVEELFEAGGEMMICINASPYHLGKREMRRSVYRAAARRYGKTVVYVNQVGGNDQLVFDGSSFAMSGAGEVFASARSFEEDLVAGGYRFCNRRAARRFLRRMRGRLPGAGPRHARLYPQVRFFAGSDRPERWNRFFLDRRDCRRSGGEGKRNRCRDARPVLFRSQRPRRARDGAEAGNPVRNRVDLRRLSGFRRRAGAVVRGSSAGCDRGESAIQTPRRHSDGAVE